MPEIKFAYTILYVKDVAVSLDFYRKAFDLELKFITPEKDYGELLSGATTLAFVSHELANSNLPQGYLPSQKGQKPFGRELGFTSTDVDATYAQALTNGATQLEPVVTKPWGQKVGYVQDPDGFLIEICSPMAG